MSQVTSKNTMLAEAWNELLHERPNLRIRDAAKELGVSEAELLATKIGTDVIRLQGPWPDLLVGFKTLGRVMSLTRNDSCILEHKGSFQKIDVMGSGNHAMATVVGPIELRVFFAAWHLAFAVTDKKADRVLRSIQVFDKAGDAIIKVYLQEGSKEDAYEKIIADFRAADQRTPLEVTPWTKETLDVDVNKDALLEEWGALKDTHDFFGMIRKHKVSRLHAVELANGAFTFPIDAQVAPQQILEEAAASKLPIMVFAGNRGNIQIHQGKVRTIRVLERGSQKWLNVLDPDFNMHLLMDDVHSGWVVKKPTTEGDVTSVELFDVDGNLIAQFFGLRKPGIPEREAWRELINNLGHQPITSDL
ncbi:MAG TPA: ChuX/HutX family heme-like substrate-binding protein [Cyclobacteriaceae bacterium]|nr:ChuX/HutX family heme-like substrate-binding protein [Cyclobacteriaceae bacterium]